MKKLLVVLLALGSISSFATESESRVETIYKTTKDTTQFYGMKIQKNQKCYGIYNETFVNHRERVRQQAKADAIEKCHNRGGYTTRNARIVGKVSCLCSPRNHDTNPDYWDNTLDYRTTVKCTVTAKVRCDL